MKMQLWTGQSLLVLTSLVLAFANDSAQANPHGMTVVSGSATTQQKGNQLQITTTTQNTYLNWNSFNIAAGETTIFNEPSATSIVFNNIKSGNASSIFGSLQANGIVVLENQKGFYFGPNALVKAAGLVVTTTAVSPWSSGGGVGWSFDGPPAKAPIVNYGHLETTAGGSLFLIAKEIENQGTIETPGGTAALLAGQQVLLSERPDGLGLSAPVELPAGSVDNQGRIVADAGQVLLQAQTVNNSGTLQANSVRQENGVIELYASQEVQLASTSVIQANGGNDEVSQGGTIAIKSGGTFSDSAGSLISANGGANGGNGGKVEVSAPKILSLNSKIDASAQAGWTEGLFSMDPENIVLGNFSSGSTSAGTSGVIDANGSSGTVDVDVGSAFQNVNASILLEATGNITLSPGINWNLSTSTGKTSGQLTLEAGGNITLGSGTQPSLITDANNWSVTLEAGYNLTTGQVVSGTGNVALNGASSIQTAAGTINVLAGNSVSVGNGGIVTGIANGVVMTSGGGNISVQALSGNVNCGNSTAGYDFTDSDVPGFVDPNLGGISTASGGNVVIQAGGNISAPLPGGNSAIQSDYGSGAFGYAPGNVTLTAGGNVTGHYVVGNGLGTITCENAGTVSGNLALSLTTGSWQVNAANNIYLQEVRNPNGAFNYQLQGNPYNFLFNYDPLASVVLDAGQGVTITGASVPRIVGANEAIIFPPTLTIDAGSGGLTLDKSVNLYPSPNGTLNVTTTDGGSLSGNNKGFYLSDNSEDQWGNTKSFTILDPLVDNGLHMEDPNPVQINISGSVSDFSLVSSKVANMYVAGNLVDSSATIQNLHPTDTSIISVGGEILDHSSFVIITLPAGETPNFNELDQVSEPYITGPGGIAIPNPNLIGALTDVQTLFSYDPASGTLKYEGKMSPAEEAALLSMAIPFLDATTIETIYTQSQNEATSADAGYKIAGPGILQIKASSIDLGNGGGIVSQGIAAGTGVVPFTARGADIDISVSGNFSMLASGIESEYGGDINIFCGGSMDVGSVLVPSTAGGQLLGIVSLWSGNISVVAEGNINVDGSRIAAYDGGNIFVESLEGNVTAGTGGSGVVLVQKPFVNGNGQVQETEDAIPGSGILATSFPQLVYGQTAGQIGNITVLTPQGNIEANRGGIVQLALGPVTHNDATITLDAGSPGYIGDVDANGSGVVGGQVNISATGNVNGLVVASVGANVNALQNVSATVLSQGAASVSAGGTVSGTVVGVGSVSVSGASDVAAAFSGGAISTSGAVSGNAVSAAPTGTSSASAAATSQQVTQSTQANSDVASNGNGNTDDNDPLKKKKSQLMQYAGRVTVLLPK